MCGPCDCEQEESTRMLKDENFGDHQEEGTEEPKSAGSPSAMPPDIFNSLAAYAQTQKTKDSTHTTSPSPHHWRRHLHVGCPERWEA